MNAHTVAEPLPIPASFPVEWEHPEDERLFWRYDRMHTPGQTTPMDGDFWRILYTGLERGHAHYGIPHKMRVQHINTFVYAADAAQPPAPEQEQQIKERVGAAIGQLQNLWENEWLPAIMDHIHFWQSFDLASATMPELVAHFDESERRIQDAFNIHFRVVTPSYGAIGAFDDLYRELFGTESPFGSYALLEGFPNKTVEVGQAIFRLSRQALAEPAVAAILASNEVNPREQLQQTAAGRDFLAALDNFLQEHGHRNELWGLDYPSWIEDPTPVYRTLRDYVAQPDLQLDAALTAAAERRQERIAAVRAQLQGYPQPVVEQFESLLQAAQVGTVVTEDHGYWIDFYCVDCFRQIVREFGRRLAARGVIEAPEDVFFLSLEEVRAAALAEPAPDHTGDVAERKAKMQQFAGVHPPHELGTPSASEPEDSPESRGSRRFFGGPPPDGSTPELIRGNSGSAGKVQGRVKVVHSLSEASKLAPGDILVAVTTAPPWTPLFATVGAVITDTGGVLSHCAVVAREYAIPAVVGTGVATAYLRDDQWVEVDGDAGTVRVLEVS